ncbi:INO80 complex subunit E [Myiozetetes cayanensis]|uniref:INO80 complex subunit E n=1 Tax=Myiozetetes cayanensis TaxID=478635 RepID=UPI00215DEEDD|nr:INO80 complex subunit E [Myiozetetes cayanensis]
MNGAAEPEGSGYKRRVRGLKRRLKLLLYEQECFQEELRRAQRKLLKVSRDKSFLLDRLLQYENVDDDSSDSEATASSDNSDGDGAKGAEPPTAKRWAGLQDGRRGWGGTKMADRGWGDIKMDDGGGGGAKMAAKGFGGKTKMAARKG